MSVEQPGYLAYLLRMWRVEMDGAAHWRASLERPGNGERYVFGSLEAAYEFLLDRTSERGEVSPVPPDEQEQGSEKNKAGAPTEYADGDFGSG